MKNNFFSVIVAIYEAEWESLKMTLDSIVLQKYTDYEIVIADDGSNKKNKEKLEDYFANKSIKHKFVFNESNQFGLEDEII